MLVVLQVDIIQGTHACTSIHTLDFAREVKKKGVKHERNIAQSAGAVEYTDCTSAEG